MKKKWQHSLLALSTFTLLAAPQVTPAATSSTMQINIDGQYQTYDVTPYVKNNRTLVPLRGIFEALGAKVTWTPDKPNLITATRADVTITMTIGANTATVNGETVTLDQPAEVKNNRTFVPVRFVSEAMGADVSWDSTTNDVDILSGVYPVGASVKRQAITLPLSNGVNTLDPALAANTIDMDVLAQTNEGLTRLDAGGHAVPGVASSWDVSDDGLTYTFHLRSDAKWSDGSTVTAHDFEYAWKRLLNPSMKSPWADLLLFIKGAIPYNSGSSSADQVGVTAVDDQTLQVKLTQAFHELPSTVALTYLFPVKQSFVEGHGDHFGKDVNQVLSNGPFKLAFWAHGRYLVITKNNSYWDQSHVQLNKITFQTQSQSAQEALYKSGKLDGFYLNADQYSTYENMAGLQTVNQLVSGYLQFNENVPVLKNTKIRQALAYAIDQNLGDLLTATYGDMATPATGFVPNGISDGNGGDYRTASGDLLDSKDNAAKAKDLLAQGMQELGITEFPTLQLRGDNSLSSMKATLFISQQWQDVLGISVIGEDESYSQTFAAEKDGNYDVSLNMWGADYNDPMDFLELLASNNPYNFTGYKNPAYDTLLTQVSNDLDPQVRLQDMIRAEKLLMQDMPIAPLFYRKYSYMLQPYVKQFVMHNLGAEYDLKSVYLDK